MKGFFRIKFEAAVWIPRSIQLGGVSLFVLLAVAGIRSAGHRYIPPPQPSSIPYQESKAIDKAVDEADQLALKQLRGSGYDRISFALDQAYVACERGVPYGAALVERCQVELDAYERRRGAYDTYRRHEWREAPRPRRPTVEGDRIPATVLRY